jgi:hypothetical protein
VQRQDAQDWIPFDTQPWASACSLDGCAAEWSAELNAACISIAGIVPKRLDFAGFPGSSMVVNCDGNPYNQSNPTTEVRHQLVLPPVIRELFVMPTSNAQFALDIPEASQFVNVTVHGEERRPRGRVVLALDNITKLALRRAVVEVESSSRNTKARNPSINRVYCHHSVVTLDNRRIGNLRVRDSSTVNTSHTRLTGLSLEPGVRLGFFGPHEVRNVSSGLAGSLEATDITKVAPATLKSGSNLHVSRGNRLHMQLESGAHFSGDDLRHVVIDGPGSVQVGQRATGVRFGPSAPSVHLAGHAQALDVHGRLKLMGAVQAKLLSSADDPIMIESAATDADALRGCSLSEVRFPVSPGGLETISALLVQAGRVAPNVHAGLPGRSPEERWYAGARRQKRRLEAPVDRHSAAAVAALETEYARSLAELAEIRGAPASTRTLLVWCAYRVHNRTAPGRVERALLSLYRLLGYGERPIPAFLTYIIVALAVSAAACARRAWDLSPEGAGEFLTAWGYWLASPLHVLSFASGEGDRAIAHNFALTLIGIPFLTGVFAMRKYVKAR